MPHYSRTHLSAFGYELPPVVVTTAELEERLAPLYKQLHVPMGQLEALTGIHERRWWEAGTPLSKGAIAAGKKALAAAGVPPADLGALVYTGVCRENFEPATACRVAEGLGVSGQTAVYDLSNACLGVLNGVLDMANRIELGQIRAGLVVSCESAREINETMIARLLEDKRMEAFVSGLATLTGGSGAVALVMTDGSFGGKSHRLRGGVTRVAPEHHELCRWGVETRPDGKSQPFMATDSVAVLKHGVQLGSRTWQDFLVEMKWTPEEVHRVICHQVGSGHQEQILKALGIAPDKDYATYGHLGNTGTVALPLAAALADERGILEAGQKVAFLGIGSGLNCLMLGWEW